MKTAELIDLARARAGIQSDYRLAKVLGLTPQTISQWRSGKSFPDMLRVFQLAQMAELQHIDTAVAAIELERVKARPEQATAWRQVLQKLGGIAAAVIVSVGLGGLAGVANPASARVAGEPGGSSAAVDRSIHSARKRRRSTRSTIADAAAVALAALSPTRHATA